MITPEDPRHGTRAGYLAGCHEEACCKRACRLDMKARELRALREGPLIVDAEPIRQLAKYWADRGLSMASLAAAAGVNADSVKRVVTNRIVQVRLTTFRKIMSVTEDDLPDTSLVYAELTRVRVWSMMADGQKLKVIAPAVGLPMQGNWRENPRLRVGVARAVRDLYRRSPGFGPMTGEVVRARNHGALPSMAWDDPGTLAEPVGWKPTAEPFHASPSSLTDDLIARRVAGDRTAKTRGAATIEVVRRMHYEQHLTFAEIERRTGLKEDRYVKAAAEAQAVLLAGHVTKKEEAA